MENISMADLAQSPVEIRKVNIICTKSRYSGFASSDLYDLSIGLLEEGFLSRQSNASNESFGMSRNDDRRQQTYKSRKLQLISNKLCRLFLLNCSR